MAGKKRIKIEEILKEQWFLVGILTTILLAVLNPYLGSRDGPFKTEYTVKYGAVFLIFLLSGFNIRTDSLQVVLSNYRLHFFIQFFTFVIVPFIVQLLTFILWYFDLNIWILRGLITVSCMPPPVSSAVILTRSAGGNETAAIFNSVIGSLLGVFLTPLILLFSLGSTTVVPFTQSALQLSATVLFPLFLGHSLRQLALPAFSPPTSPHKASSSTSPTALAGQIALLFIIYTTFCDAFHAHDMDLTAVDVLITIVLVVILQAGISVLSFSMAMKQFSPSDTIAAVFCSTHKSLTLGIPILRIMYHGLSHASVTALPLLVYHPCQLLLGSLLTSPLTQWARHKKRLPL